MGDADDQADASEEVVRSFVAIRLAAELQREIGRLQERLRSAGAEVKWVASEGFHLTLKFLGNVAPSRVDEVARAVGEAVDGVRPFVISFAGAGAFPDPKRPRVIWVGVDEGREDCAALAERVEAALTRLGFAPEIRPFHAHLTLGRVRSTAGIAPLAEELGREQASLGKMIVDRISLMRSQLSRAGASYTVLREINLSGEAV